MITTLFLFGRHSNRSVQSNIAERLDRDVADVSTATGTATGTALRLRIKAFVD